MLLDYMLKFRSACSGVFFPNSLSSMFSFHIYFLRPAKKCGFSSVSLGFGNRKSFWYQNALHQWLLHFGSAQGFGTDLICTSKAELDNCL